MGHKRFLLSFTVTVLLVTPWVINAKSSAPLEDLQIAPAPGQTAVVAGLKVTSKVIKHDASTATLQLTASNETRARISTEVSAALMARPEVSPMARMVPMPRELSHNTVALDLAPGETITRTITVTLPADGATVSALAGNESRLFASVRALEPQQPPPIAQMQQFAQPPVSRD